MTSAERYGLFPLTERTEPAQAGMVTVRSANDVAALVPAYSALLFRVAHAVLRNPAEAEDAVQDAFLRVLAHRDQLPAVNDIPGHRHELRLSCAGIWQRRAAEV